MKILHLADLHIGKNVLEQSMIEDQKYMLKEIIEIIKKKEIDIVLIAGDIYDRAIPSSDAVNVLNDFLNALIKELKVEVFIISGNHDSKERLNFGSKIFEKEGLHICTTYDGEIKKYVTKDEYGIINIYMLPYLKPIDIKRYFEEEIDSYDEAIKRVIKNEKINKNERNIILSHQFVTSGEHEPEKSESETLILGGTENVDVSNFDDFDYVALGHIHRPQRIGRDTARYAGTMLKYSFSEVNQKKVLTIIDFKEKGNLEYELYPLKPLRDMRVIEGPIEELVKKENIKDTNDYIRAIITNEEPIYDAIGQIRSIYPNTLRLDIKNSKTGVNLERSLSEIDNIKKKSELELFNEFYEYQNNQTMNEEQEEIIREVIEEARREAN